MAEAVARWFTPSKSDNQSGAQYNAAYNAASLPAAPTMAAAKDTAADAVLAKRRKLSKTILTGPQGLEGMGFESEKKSLLGE